MTSPATSPAAQVARRAAARLAHAAGRPLLIAEVDRELELRDSRRPPDRDEPLSVSLAALLVSVASLAWQIYTDLKQQTKRPSPEVLSRRLRVELRLPQQAQLAAAEQDRVIATVVEETLTQAGDIDRSGATDGT